MQNIYILIGAPGSGKSTFSKTIPNAVLCSADHYFINNDNQTYNFDRSKLGEAHAACLKKFVLSLIDGQQNIIVDNTNTMINDIIPYYSVARAFDASIHIRMFLVSSETSFNRNIHQVPKENCERMVENISKLHFPNRWKIASIEKFNND